MKTHLNLGQTVAMFKYVSDGIVESKDLLTQADKVIGDGDHGVAMARGFAAVRGKLEMQTSSAIGELLKEIGTALMTSAGGASGAVFGTFFRGGARHLDDRVTFDPDVLAVMLFEGLSAVKARGGAKPGDKTMVDALKPAAMACQLVRSDNLGESLVAATEAARRGMEDTKDMVAKVGKAKTLGTRSLGHPDPGAISMFLILKYMTAYVTEEEDIE